MPRPDKCLAHDAPNHRRRPFRHARPPYGQTFRSIRHRPQRR